MGFEQFPLDPRIMAGIKSAGYKTPTPIQQQAIPVVLEGRDMLGVAQTGTGKTAAFLLPILHRLTVGARRKVRVLIIAPTRELAEQTYESSINLGRNIKVRSTSIYGGVSKGAQIASLRRGVEIVVACPGRLLDLIDDRKIDLSGVEVLVLDEADRMCDMGFLPDIRRILQHLPAQRQTLFFSATMPEEIRALAGNILNRPATVQVGMVAPAATVSHTLFPTPTGLKSKLLFSMLKQMPLGRTLIFTRTKSRARHLASDLEQRGYRVSAMEGNMVQAQRQKAICGFREGKFDILVATDIAARGLDISEISHVINFDMPDNVDAYIHRIGRTGRVFQTGEAFTLAAQGEEGVVHEIEKVLGAPIQRRRVPDFDYGSFVPENLAQQQQKQPRLHHRRQPVSRPHRKHFQW
jgi:ATP-dependent RNA helicase RhlE